VIIGSDGESKLKDIDVETQPLSITRWPKETMEEEIKATPNNSLSLCEESVLITYVQDRLTKVCSDAVAKVVGNYSEDPELFPGPNLVTLETTVGKKSSCNIVQQRTGQVFLPYWGKVATSSTAAYLEKDASVEVDIYEADSGSHQDRRLVTRLFIDGSQVMNLRRSNCCFAFLVRGDKPTKHLEETPIGLSPPAKKRRVEITQGPSHQLQFCEEKCVIGARAYSIAWPRLVPLETEQLPPLPFLLIRTRSSWDDEELEKAVKERASRLFATS
jgi:hypothetical protein